MEGLPVCSHLVIASQESNYNSTHSNSRTWWKFVVAASAKPPPSSSPATQKWRHYYHHLSNPPFPAVPHHRHQSSVQYSPISYSNYYIGGKMSPYKYFTTQKRQPRYEKTWKVTVISFHTGAPLFFSDSSQAPSH